MPNVDTAILRSLMGQSSRPPSYGGGYGDPSGRLIDLLQQRADFEGEAARSRAGIWSGALQQIGSQVTGAMQQHQRQKRDSAWLSFLNGGDWQSDPRAAYARTIQIWGPEEGPKQWQGLVSATQLMQPKRDPERDAKALGAVSGAYLGMSPEGRAQLYPTLRGLVSSVVPGVQMPEQHDPAFDEQFVMPFARQYAPQQHNEGYTLSSGQTRFDASGRPIASVPAEPKEGAGFSLGPGEVRYNSAGQVVASRPAAPKAREPQRPVQIETVDEQGRAVTRFVTPEAGQSFPKPTGAARPANGQQRKALNFFNRAMEADRIAADLEEGGQIHPAALRYTPDFANALLPQNDQQYRAAQRAFTEARLRKESGATIKDNEYAQDAKTYFPQPGDSEETKAQKRAGRRAILAGIALESGDALREFYGDEADGMVAGLRSEGQAARPGAADRPVQVRNADDYNRLAPGTTYLDPMGVRRRKGGH